MTWSDHRIFQGPPEPLRFNCGYCGKPITTFWAPHYQGMIRGEDHCLLGDSVWHNSCFDEAIEENPIC